MTQVPVRIEDTAVAVVHVAPALRYGALQRKEQALLMQSAVPCAGAEVQLWQLAPHWLTDSATHWPLHAA
jgi:hypothetical protein